MFEMFWRHVSTGNILLPALGAEIMQVVVCIQWKPCGALKLCQHGVIRCVLKSKWQTKTLKFNDILETFGIVVSLQTLRDLKLDIYNM